MRRLQAALRLVPPQKFRADRDPGISVDVAIGRFELEIDPGYRRPFTKEAVRRTIRFVRLAMEQVRHSRGPHPCNGQGPAWPGVSHCSDTRTLKEDDRVTQPCGGGTASRDHPLPS